MGTVCYLAGVCRITLCCAFWLLILVGSIVGSNVTNSLAPLISSYSNQTSFQLNESYHSEETPENPLVINFPSDSNSSTKLNVSQSHMSPQLDNLRNESSNLLLEKNATQSVDAFTQYMTESLEIISNISSESFVNTSSSKQNETKEILSFDNKLQRIMNANTTESTTFPVDNLTISNSSTTGNGTKLLFDGTHDESTARQAILPHANESVFFPDISDERNITSDRLPNVLLDSISHTGSISSKFNTSDLSSVDRSVLHLNNSQEENRFINIEHGVLLPNNSQAENSSSNIEHGLLLPNITNGFNVSSYDDTLLHGISKTETQSNWTDNIPQNEYQKLKTHNGLMPTITSKLHLALPIRNMTLPSFTNETMMAVREDYYPPINKTSENMTYNLPLLPDNRSQVEINSDIISVTTVMSLEAFDNFEAFATLSPSDSYGQNNESVYKRNFNKSDKHRSQENKHDNYTNDEMVPDFNTNTTEVPVDNKTFPIYFTELSAMRTKLPKIYLQNEMNMNNITEQLPNGTKMINITEQLHNETNINNMSEPLRNETNMNNMSEPLHNGSLEILHENGLSTKQETITEPVKIFSKQIEWQRTFTTLPGTTETLNGITQNTPHEITSTIGNFQLDPLYISRASTSFSSLHHDTTESYPVFVPPDNVVLQTNASLPHHNFTLGESAAPDITRSPQIHSEIVVPIVVSQNLTVPNFPIGNVQGTTPPSQMDILQEYTTVKAHQGVAGNFTTSPENNTERKHIYHSFLATLNNSSETTTENYVPRFRPDVINTTTYKNQDILTTNTAPMIPTSQKNEGQLITYIHNTTQSIESTRSQKMLVNTITNLFATNPYPTEATQGVRSPKIFLQEQTQPTISESTTVTFTQAAISKPKVSEKTKYRIEPTTHFHELATPTTPFKYYYKQVKIQDLNAAEQNGVITAVLSKIRKHHGKDWVYRETLLFNNWVIHIVEQLMVNHSMTPNQATQTGNSQHPQVYFVLPTPQLIDDELIFTFYVNYKNDTIISEMLLPVLLRKSTELLHYMNVSHSRFESGGLNMNAALANSKNFWADVLNEHGMLIVTVSALTLLLAILLLVVIIYNRRKSRQNVHCITDTDKFQQDMHISVEIGDINSAVMILQDERNKNIITNGNHVYTADDKDGWVVPISQTPVDDRDVPDVQDTKL